MNDGNRNNNEVEYCSRVIYCLRPNTNSRKFPGFHRGGGGGGGGPVTRYYDKPTMCHNYIPRIYLKNYSKITPTLMPKDYKTIIMS